MKNSRSPSQRILSLFLSAVFISAAWALFHSEWSQLKLLHWQQFPWLAGALLVRWIRTALRSWLQQTIIRSDGVQIPYREILSLGFATTLANGILPLKSGSAYAAIFLKTRYQYSYRSYTGVILGVNVLFTLVALIIGCLAAFILWIRGSASDLSLGIITLLLALLLIGGTALLSCGNKFEKHSPKLHRILSGWTGLWRKNEVWKPAVIIVLTSTFLSALSLAFVFRAFDIRLDTLGTALLMCSQSLANLISLTPGSLGFKEALGAYFATSLGITAAQTVLVLLIFRLSGLLSYLLPGLFSFLSLSRKLKEPSAR